MQHRTFGFSATITATNTVFLCPEPQAATKLESKVLLLESKIDYCEEKINDIVCQLYVLEEAEIDLINDNARR